MGDRSRAFNEIKDLLGKLDRSIDEARERRLQDERSGREPDQTSQPHADDRSGSAPERSDPPPARSDGPSNTSRSNVARGPSSPYGRARPLRRADPKHNTSSGENTVGWRQNS